MNRERAYQIGYILCFVVTLKLWRDVVDILYHHGKGVPDALKVGIFAVAPFFILFVALMWTDVLIKSYYGGKDDI